MGMYSLFLTFSLCLVLLLFDFAHLGLGIKKGQGGLHR